MGIYDHSGNVHIINEIQSKDMFNMSSPFHRLHVIQELNLENRQLLNYLNLVFYKILVIPNIVEGQWAAFGTELHLNRTVNVCGDIIPTNNHSKGEKRQRQKSEAVNCH